MKMNKVLKGLLIGVLVIGMTGCQEAKQVENIEVQDTKPVVEEKVEEKYENKYCADCGNRADYCECDKVAEEATLCCITCGKAHNKYESYYSEGMEGMSACSQECFDTYLEDNGIGDLCDMCGIRDDDMYSKFLDNVYSNMRVCIDCYHMACHKCLTPKTQKPFVYCGIYLCEDCYKVEYAEEIKAAQAKRAEEEAIQARINAREICPECHSENVNWYKENPNLVTEEVARQWWFECYDCGAMN